MALWGRRPSGREAKLSWLALIALGLCECASDLDASLDGKPCDSSGDCVEGYVCDPQTLLCVRPGEVAAACSGDQPCEGPPAAPPEPDPPKPVPPGPEGCSASTTLCSACCSDVSQDPGNC